MSSQPQYAVSLATLIAYLNESPLTIKADLQRFVLFMERSTTIPGEKNTALHAIRVHLLTIYSTLLSTPGPYYEQPHLISQLLLFGEKIEPWTDAATNKLRLELLSLIKQMVASSEYLKNSLREPHNLRGLFLLAYAITATDLENNLAAFRTFCGILTIIDAPPSCLQDREFLETLDDELSTETAASED